MRTNSGDWVWNCVCRSCTSLFRFIDLLNVLPHTSESIKNLFQNLAMIYLPWHRHEPRWVFVLLCQSVVDFGTNVKFPWSGGFLDFQHGIQISNSVIIATVTPHSLENFAITPFTWNLKSNHFHVCDVHADCRCIRKSSHIKVYIS